MSNTEKIPINSLQNKLWSSSEPGTKLSPTIWFCEVDPSMIHVIAPVPCLKDPSLTANPLPKWSSCNRNHHEPMGCTSNSQSRANWSCKKYSMDCEGASATHSILLYPVRHMQLPVSLTVAFRSVASGGTFVQTPCAKNHWVPVCTGITLWRYQCDSQTFQQWSDWGSKNQPIGILEPIQVPRGLANCWLQESCRLMVKAYCHTHQSLNAGWGNLGHCQGEAKGFGLF